MFLMGDSKFVYLEITIFSSKIFIFATVDLNFAVWK